MSAARTFMMYEVRHHGPGIPRLNFTGGPLLEILMYGGQFNLTLEFLPPEGGVVHPHPEVVLPRGGVRLVEVERGVVGRHHHGGHAGDLGASPLAEQLGVDLTGAVWGGVTGGGREEWGEVNGVVVMGVVAVGVVVIGAVAVVVVVAGLVEMVVVDPEVDQE